VIAKSAKLALLTRKPRKYRLTACLRSSGERLLLDDSGTWSPNVAVDGRVVGYSIFDDEAGTRIVLIRRVGDHPTFKRFADGGKVTDIVVRHDLAAAWVITGATFTEVRAAPTDLPDGDQSVELDHGEGIDAHSLNLRGHRLSWRHGGRTHHAVLN
jgi:hypothetical protein